MVGKHQFKAGIGRVLLFSDNSFKRRPLSADEIPEVYLLSVHLVDALIIK